MEAIMIIILIFALPVLAAAGFLFYGIRCRVIRKENEKTPGAYPQDKWEDCRRYRNICGVIALIAWTVLIGGYLLLEFGAIAYM